MRQEASSDVTESRESAIESFRDLQIDDEKKKKRKKNEKGNSREPEATRWDEFISRIQ